jgi:UDP-glucuronate decarboxylase
VNLGNPVEFTVRELADEVCRIVGQSVRVTYKPLPQDDPTQRQPDITRAREWLNWEPRIPLSQGLERTVDYFRERIERKRRSNRQVALEADGHAAGD